MKTTTTGGRLRNLAFQLPPGVDEVVFVLPDGRRLEVALTETFPSKAQRGPDGKAIRTPSTLLLGLKECPAPAAAA